MISTVMNISISTRLELVLSILIAATNIGDVNNENNLDGNKLRSQFNFLNETQRKNTNLLNDCELATTK